MKETTADVRLAQQDTALDRDFVLTVECGRPRHPHAWLERVTRAHRPWPCNSRRDWAEPAPCEVTFVIDRSGSMEGTSIAEVQKTPSGRACDR